MEGQDMQAPDGQIPLRDQPEQGQEMQEDKGRGAEDREDRYQRDPLGFLMLAFALFWLGVYLLLRNRHVFPDTEQSWAYLVWGLAALAYVEIVIRLLVPKWRSALGRVFVWAAIWTGVGIGLWTGGDWGIIGPVVLIAIGIGMIISRLVPRR
jgi:hypothetical protein